MTPEKHLLLLLKNSLRHQVSQVRNTLREIEHRMGKPDFDGSNLRTILLLLTPYHDLTVKVDTRIDRIISHLEELTNE